MINDMFERLDIWEGFRDRIHKLFSDVEDALNCEFSDGFCHCSYSLCDIHDEHGAAVYDLDTPNARKLLHMLEALDNFVSAHTDKVLDDFKAWEEYDYEEREDTFHEKYGLPA